MEHGQRRLRRRNCDVAGRFGHGGGLAGEGVADHRKLCGRGDQEGEEAVQFRLNAADRLLQGVAVVDAVPVDDQFTVALARAVVTDPALVLADEPTGALDSVSTFEVLSMFVDEKPQSGHEIVRATVKTLVKGPLTDFRWKKLLADGVIGGTAWKPAKIENLAGKLPAKAGTTNEEGRLCS